MKTRRSPFQKPPRRLPGKRVTGSGNTNTDAYPHDSICAPKSLLHPEDGRAHRRPS